MLDDMAGARKRPGPEYRIAPPWVRTLSGRYFSAAW